LSHELIRAQERENTIMAKARDHRKLRSHTLVGGYPLFYRSTNDGVYLHVFCPDCARRVWAASEPEIEPHVNWESLMYCDECSLQIEAAYDVVH
jgi:hypothetical protein